MDRMKLAIAAVVFLGVMTSQAAARCCGDCDDDGEVGINELIRAVLNSLDGCSDEPRFVDNGDGTVTDNETGLMWEKKTGTLGEGRDCPDFRSPRLSTCGDPHNVNNRYQWSIDGERLDGPVRTDFLDVLNDEAGDGASCFAGHCDWRLPTMGGIDFFSVVNAGELDSIVDCSVGPPCIDASFGVTASEIYWSSSTAVRGLFDSDPTSAWGRGFARGSLFRVGKLSDFYVRAVRGGY